MLRVKEGLILILQFTAFDIEQCSSPTEGDCACDYLTITDGDGTTLMDKTCGGSTYGHLVIGGQSKGSLLPTVISRSNIVFIMFTTSDSIARSGWSLTWPVVSSATGDLG